MSIESKVRNFHRVFGHPVNEVPALLPRKRALLRYDMIQEEAGELLDAVAAEDLVEIADALADIVWLCYGAAAEYGITLDDVLAEVDRSNLSKLDENGEAILAGPNDPDGLPEGKIKKGPNYSPPQIAPILEEQGWRKA